MGFDFEVQYKPGLKNKTANALSRLPLYAELKMLTILWELIGSSCVVKLRQILNYELSSRLCNRIRIARQVGLGLEMFFVTKEKWW